MSFAELFCSRCVITDGVDAGIKSYVQLLYFFGLGDEFLSRLLGAEVQNTRTGSEREWMSHRCSLLAMALVEEHGAWWERIDREGNAKDGRLGLVE